MPDAFIEHQFPIARLSAEAYKERKANNSQTLTRLGKWWGRKPLILVRASVLAMLMPASDNPVRDREIFLKILTMDDEGAWRRCKGDIPAAAWRDAAPVEIQEEFFSARGWKQGLTDEEKSEVCERIGESLDAAGRAALDARRRRPVPDRAAFDALPYAERIAHCERPENAPGPDAAAWAEINAHLGTSANSLSELLDQLGRRTFGRTPRVGDCFAGGGSIPFEAARIGCSAFGSDLNPVAGLLTWAGLNLLGGGQAVQEEVMRTQASVFREADRQVTEWGIEHNSRGERADAFLYCVEVKPEGCDYFIPLAPSWLVGEKTRAIVAWHRQAGSDRLHPEVRIVSADTVAEFKKGQDATYKKERVIDPFNPERTWSLESLRGPEGLRRWTNEDIVPRPGDALQERLYCIRWVDKAGNRRYAAPDAEDLARETRVLALLRERFADWQREGFIPSTSIKSGVETDRLSRERGWTNWHHLFTPRQLLTHGLLAEAASRLATTQTTRAACFLGLGRMANWNSRLCRWRSDPAGEGVLDVFNNQALNTLLNYGNRPLPKLDTAWFLALSKTEEIDSNTDVVITDARDLTETCDLWITDPPYADAVNYHELGDFFLSWYDKQLPHVFPEWVPDARAQLAVRGDGDDFRRSMVDIYKNLARHMPDNGLQMVMFTHQNPAVWADLGMILWAAGLKATAAWTIATETEASGIKKGNYVQGTVCLVLRKRLGGEAGFLDEITPMVEDEVHRQIDAMRALDDAGEPNFSDADYQLAAYAAALKVLTHYATIDGREVEHEVFAVRDARTPSAFQQVIERAITIACDYLKPRGLESVWNNLSQTERYYMRALDIESRGERRQGMYEELARGFGVTDIKPLLESDKANGARMVTASGLKAATLANPGAATATAGSPARRGRVAAGGPHPFAPSPLRHLLFAVRETAANDSAPEVGRNYLRETFSQDYWIKRQHFIAVLDWLAALANTPDMAEWSADSAAAALLAGRLRNDQA